MNMHTMVYSPTGNTKKIIIKIREQFADESEDWDITVPDKRESLPTFSKEDTLLVGVPVYAGRVPKLLLNYFSRLNGNQAKVILVVSYGNRDYEDALLELKDIFEARDFVAIAAATFIGEHSSTELLGTARPDEKDLSVAVEFGKKIGEKLSRMQYTNELIQLDVPGNRPYIEKNMQMPLITPETDEKCVQCGICAKHCPTAAINFNDCKIIDSSKCIKCRSCVKRCPFHAKSIKHPAYLGMQKMLVENFAGKRREAEYYI